MKQCIVKYPSLKILFTLVFIFSFSNKLRANTTQTDANLITPLSLIINLDNDEGVVLIDFINLGDCTEEEEDFSSNFSITPQNNNVFIKDNIVFNKNIVMHTRFLQKKRLYILYCQLKVHL